MLNQLKVFGVNTIRAKAADTAKVTDENTIWWASDYLEMLGYPSTISAGNPINRAMRVCVSAGVRPHNHFIEMTRDVNGHQFTDFKLTQYACYLITMNCDA